MEHVPAPDSPVLATTAQLVRSALAAVVVAAALTVTVVMPAEYAVDPTGVGRMLGLTQMGEIKIALVSANANGHPPDEPTASDSWTPDPTPSVAEAVPVAPAVAPPPPAATWNETVVTLAPDEAAEVKVEMAGGKTVTYEWSTDGAAVNFDLHADAPGIDYHRYERGSTARASGELKAAFTGMHGWFWRNRSGKPATITLRVRGDYVAVRRVM